MKNEANLTVGQVARAAVCHRNTVLNYEKRGYIKPLRDNNNFRRFTIQEALKLKQLLEIRRPFNN
jgi:DNA-binding transcriptional MerR regulator